jgi:hypothetical protein
MNTQGRSLELFFVNGRPDGMLTADVFNWPGHVLKCPRTQLSEALARPEARQSGVYLLIGQNDDGPLAYIGETECMSVRLKDHAAKLDWWDEAVLITAAGDPLHKAHVKYLESRLIEIAKEAKQISLHNSNMPPRASLNEAAIANMESFLETLSMVLPAIRVDFLQIQTRPAAPQQDRTDNTPTPLFHLHIPKHGIQAKAVISGGEVVVQKGSQARCEWAGSRAQNTHYFKLHDQLLSNRTIVVQGEVAVFTENYAFSSPSAAAAVVAGRSANGRTAWKLPDGRTYADWEQDTLNED